MVSTGGSWQRIHDDLAGRDPSSLSGAELDLLADACFWLDRPEASVGYRRHAHAAHTAAGDLPAAAMSAWRLFYDHELVGEHAAANGWLQRARQHVADRLDSVEAGWVELARADHCARCGDLDAALGAAESALDSGRRHADVALVAMAQHVRGRLLLTSGAREQGLACLDEVMLVVLEDVMDPFFTGWLYCGVLGACVDAADLGRAAEWSHAAVRWAADQPEGGFYPGLCRVYRVEVDRLRGSWSTALAEIELALSRLEAHDPRYAGEAAYLLGELRRLTGDLQGAESAFRHALELGRRPEPGMARIWLARGHAEAAATALRVAESATGSAPWPRTQLLAALVDAELAVGGLAAARRAADELGSLGSLSPCLSAVAMAADAAVRNLEGDCTGALRAARDAWSQFRALEFPYDAALAQVTAAAACRAAGDLATARLELESALHTLASLGAAPDVDRVRGMLEGLAESGSATPAGLSAREVEVLRLVAEGRTNRQVGSALHISERTVARHLSNLFTKIGVSSRAAATAYAYEHGLVERTER